MGIWVRSQDKEILINVIAVGVDIGSNIYAITNNDKLEPLVIGNYSTKEKALQVIDEMEEWINGLEFSRNVKSCRCNFVYQMPQNIDEVK